MTTLPTTLNFSLGLEPGPGLAKPPTGSGAARKGIIAKNEGGLSPFDRLLQQAGEKRSALLRQTEPDSEDTDAATQKGGLLSVPTTDGGSGHEDRTALDPATLRSVVPNDTDPLVMAFSTLPDPVATSDAAVDPDAPVEKPSPVTDAVGDKHPHDDSAANLSSLTAVPSDRSDPALNWSNRETSTRAAGEAPAAINRVNPTRGELPAAGSPSIGSAVALAKNTPMALAEAGKLDSSEPSALRPSDADSPTTVDSRLNPVSPIVPPLSQPGTTGLSSPITQPSPLSTTEAGSRSAIARAAGGDQGRPEPARTKTREPGTLREEAPDRSGSVPSAMPGRDMPTETPATSPSGTPSASAPSTVAAGSTMNAISAQTESSTMSPMSGIPTAGPVENPLRGNGTFDTQAPAGYTSDRISESIHETAFPRALGLKIEQWVQDGVQQVWLDVHPADMGPVAISIALDGQQAELNFGAESASARQAIESSLPELAAALQNAGLTLSGGSISQQLSQSQGQEERAASSSTNGAQPGSGQGGAISTADQMPRRRTVGLLDLYA